MVSEPTQSMDLDRGYKHVEEDDSFWIKQKPKSRSHPNPNPRKGQTGEGPTRFTHRRRAGTDPATARDRGSRAMGSGSQRKRAALPLARAGSAQKGTTTVLLDGAARGSRCTRASARGTTAVPSSPSCSPPTRGNEAEPPHMRPRAQGRS
jgi:hypothetical protein